MTLSEPTLDGFGALLMEHVRDRAIQDSDGLIASRGSAATSVVARRTRELLATFDAQQLEAVHRLIPIIVDTTLHHLLWVLEQWDSVQVAVQTESGSVADIRTLTVGELQGYLYDWIPRFSRQRYEPPI